MDDLKSIPEELKKLKRGLYQQEDCDRLANFLNDLKTDFVKLGDQENAMLVWCYEEILLIYIFYLNAFFLMKKHEFFEAWCYLEKCEKHLEYLENHFDIKENNDEFSLTFIKIHVNKFQSIYPNYIYQSPSLVIKKTKCSICGKETSLRNHCGHLLGEIYDGKRCVRYPTEFEVNHSAIVDNPKWKYRVLFTTDDETGKKIDKYDYSLIMYLIDILPSPLVEWEYKRTKMLYPHSIFSAFMEDDSCPCGSGEEYGECCLKKERVLKDHIDFYGFKPLYEPEIKIDFPLKPLNNSELPKDIKKDMILTGISYTKESFYID